MNVICLSYPFRSMLYNRLSGNIMSLSANDDRKLSDNTLLLIREILLTLSSSLEQVHSLRFFYGNITALIPCPDFQNTRANLATG